MFTAQKARLLCCVCVQAASKAHLSVGKRVSYTFRILTDDIIWPTVTSIKATGQTHILLHAIFSMVFSCLTPA